METLFVCIFLVLVEYQVYPTMKWKPALFEQSVVEEVSSKNI